MTAVGLDGVSAEVGQVVFSLALATLGRRSSAASSLDGDFHDSALTGNTQMRFPVIQKPFAWLEACAAAIVPTKHAFGTSA